MIDSIPLLRQKLRQRRRNSGLTCQHRASKCLMEVFQHMDEFRHSRRLALYLPNDGELDCRQLIKLSWALGKRCYLPVLSHNELGPHLNFALHLPGRILTKNRYGILEPAIAHKLSAASLDLVLVPLVGYDRAGNRLGMGGGYYDRTFAHLRGAAKPLLIGVAHRHQEVNRLPVQPWDVPMDKIVAV
ncbi:MAG: 5-formyltetrahydrofolate cyclo-ligase [Cellvibrionaceae bacterium]|jgi:5-formyltetrahydrofolate cyclo-ligase